MDAVDKYCVKWASILGVSVAAAVEGLLTAVSNSLLFFIPSMILIIWDMLSAMKLNSRVTKKYPSLVKAKCSKIKSRPAMKAAGTVVKMFLGIILGSYIDQLNVFPDYVGVNIVFIGFMVIQLWSILENTSSENNRPWAKIAQMVVINKASRHLNLDKNILERLLIEQKQIAHDNKIKNLRYSCGGNTSDNDGSTIKVPTQSDTNTDGNRPEGEGQRLILSDSFRWTDGTKFDIEDYRGLLQELQRQFDDYNASTSKGDEDQGQSIEGGTGDDNVAK